MAFVAKHLPDPFYLGGDQRISIRDHFFREIGRTYELGSGVRKLYKYTRAYSGADPQLQEGDIFKVIIPLTPQDERTGAILNFCKTPQTRGEIQKFLGLKDREHFRLEILIPLLEQGLLQPTIPDKLNSPRQKYYSGKLNPPKE